MITTVTLNPMLDKTVFVSGIRHGAIVRASGIDMVVGGKGVNVSRQLTRLDVSTTASGFLGGEIGSMLERMLDAEGIRHRFVRVTGMTREGVTYLDEAGVMTSVFEPPHAVEQRDVERLRETCRDLVAASTWLVCCGSSPSPDADMLYADVIREARARGKRTALDSYGAPLRAGIAARPDLLKINRHEYEQTSGAKAESEHDVMMALDRLLSEGIGKVVLTDGERAAYAADGSSVWKVVPPPITSVNPTGSGDSMLAGMLFGIEQGWEMPAWLAFGAAAGAANAAVREVSASSRATIDQLLDRIQPQRIA
jgi:1-phosphofructokinase family hexose kinase